MRFSFSWPVLGLLIERQSYGYELMQRFERVFGDTLVLSGPKPIYQALEELHDRGLVERVQGDVSADAPPRRPNIHYGATEQGMHAYKAWLLEQAAEQRRRSVMFTRQLAMLEPEKALEVIDRYERDCVTETDETASKTERDGDVGNRLEDEDERLALGVRLSWIEYARGELEELVAKRASDDDAEQ
jgi:DNA-binding PadR family transcriptional regulator